MGELVSIVYKPNGAGAPADGYTRVPLQEAELIAGHGIQGDAKGGSGNRHLNIMAAETVSALAAEGFRAEPGQLGEQLRVAGLPIDSLTAGTRLRIGESAIVEVGEPRTGCGKFEQHQGRLRQEAAGRMGVMARVIEGGPIRIGDIVQEVEASQE